MIETLAEHQQIGGGNTKWATFENALVTAHILNYSIYSVL